MATLIRQEKVSQINQLSSLLWETHLVVTICALRIAIQVREDCISFTARMDRKHRPIYDLDSVHRHHAHKRRQPRTGVRQRGYLGEVIKVRPGTSM